MFQVARSRDSRLQEQSSKILKSIFLMTAFQHLIIKQMPSYDGSFLRKQKKQLLSLLHSVSVRSYMQSRSLS